MRFASRVALGAAVLLPALSLAAPPAGAAPDSVGEPTSAGTAIVGFATGALPSVAPGATYRGLEVAQVARNGDFLVVEASDVAAVRRAVAGAPGVAYVEDNQLSRATVTPNDPRYGEQYGPNIMQFPTAWGKAPGYGSSSVKVAVIDSGLFRTHEDFTPTSRFLTGRDYVSNDNDPQDNCGHGTHVTGTIAATTNNGKGVAGMSQATIIPMRVLSASLIDCSGSHAAIAQSIRDAADQGARVISMSIGGGSSTTLESAVNYAWNKGSILVAASGNDGGSNSVDYPGAYSNVIAVGSVTSTKARSSFSDGGPQLDIMGPGSNVLSTTYSSNTSYGQMSGTSMATPHVAGAIALALSCAPTATNTAVRNALLSTAEDLGAAGYDQLYGHGLARADRLVDALCGSGGGGTNTAPTASFTTSTSGLTVSVNGTGSSDPDGDALSYTWSWGDATANGSGATASHTYAAAGTYTVTLTVSDGRGGSNSTTRTVTVSAPSDPDPGATTLTSGQSVSTTIAAGQEKFYKINVPSGRSQLQVVMTGPACGLLSCSVDADLYTHYNARPTDTLYTCRPYASGSSETCTHASPTAGWWYIRIDGYSGSGTVTITATY